MIVVSSTNSNVLSMLEVRLLCYKPLLKSDDQLQCQPEYAITFLLCSVTLHAQKRHVAIQPCETR